MLQLKQKFRPWLYKIKHQIFTKRNILVILASFLALSWILSAILAMQQNYVLQKKVDKRKQQLAVLKLETETLAIEKDYFKSAEYQELVARQSLGLGIPGEKVLILPSYSDWVKQQQAILEAQDLTVTPQISNFNQWINFLFGSKRNQ